MSHDIYLYGMIIQTLGFLLAGDYPPADSYAEIKELHTFPGGETGAAAVVLSSLGCRVKIDGNYLGRDTGEYMRTFFTERGIDCSRLVVDESFDGVKDYVIIDKNTRTCFGKFGQFFSNPIKRWNQPDRADIFAAKTAAIDPFIEDGALTAAQFCLEAGVPYVTIDCKYDSFLAQNAAVIAVSGEFLRGTYPGQNREDLIVGYTDRNDGLVIFTGGGGEILYARRNGGVKRTQAFSVDVVSTLGAGDTFKAGCTYGLHKRMADDELVRYAAACAGDAVTRFPITINPPTLERIGRLLKTRSED